LDCDVLICGLGPVGQLLALLLDGLGVSVVAFDRADAPYDLPRAAVVDDEVLRIFQAAGVVREVLDASQPQPAVSFVNRKGRATLVFRTVDGALGYPPLVSIHQPSFERVMVAALERRGVHLRWGCELDSFDQRTDGVSVSLRPVAGGAPQDVTARYLVGCDGARSTLRSRLGIEFGGSTFAQRWLVVDGLVDRPLAKVPHPHFIGDLGRPAVSLPMSPGRHRWEWMLHPGEDPEPFLDHARIRSLMARWIAGEQVEIERAVVYTFHARRAARWRDGRVLLAGDAAHVTPPFVGQGFGAGARDAANLAWKLDAVLRGAPESLLDSYQAERYPHVKKMQNFAIRWGGIVQTTQPRTGRIRDGVIAALDRSGILGLLQAHAKPLPTAAAGAFAARPHRLPFMRTVGALFPQPEVEGRPLDERLGNGWAAVSRSSRASATLRAAGLVVAEIPDDVWLRRHRVDFALLRPDRYVFSAGTASEAESAVASARRLVGSSLEQKKGS
jgi:2-polyprenyl-6-methoxyphenol hydroxylase-like FAD-dependent oxidoreductase